MNAENVVGLVLAVAVSATSSSRCLPGAARMSAASWLQLAVLSRSCWSRRACSAPTSPGSTAAARRPATGSSLPVERAASTASAASTPSASSVERLRASRCSRSASSRCSGSTCCSGCRACCRSNPTDVDGGAAGARVQHRGQLRDQHELAELRRRVDDEPPHPDGRARGAELRLGRRRHRRRGRADPRPRPPPARRRSATSGSTSPAARSGSCCRSRSSFALVLVEPGRRPELPRRHRRARRCRARRRRSPAARSRARRRSRSSARTAAGSSTPTRPTRSRTRTAFTNFLEIFAAPGDPVRAHRHVRPDGQGPAAGLGRVRGDVRRSGSARPALAIALRGRRQPDGSQAHRRRRRQHGGQGGPLRRRGVRPLRGLDDRARRPARSTRATTASRRSAARCRSST